MDSPNKTKMLKKRIETKEPSEQDEIQASGALPKRLIIDLELEVKMS